MIDPNTDPEDKNEDDSSSVSDTLRDYYDKYPEEENSTGTNYDSSWNWQD